MSDPKQYWDVQEMGGHLWYESKGPGSICAECKLPYRQWSGDVCPGPTAPSITITDEMLNSMAEISVSILSVMGPVFEATQGVKKKMVAEGWSVEAAETIALGYFQTCSVTIIKGMEKQ